MKRGPSPSFFAAAFLCAVVPGATAQTYPSRSITIVTLNPPASTPDIVGRAIAQKLSEAWRQSIIMDNKPGGGAVIGTEAVARSAPDGYTLLLHTATLAIQPSMHKQLPYDPIKSFTPISMIAFVPNVLVTHPTLPAKDVKELIALAKSRPGKLDYSSSGPGTPPDVIAKLNAEIRKALTAPDVAQKIASQGAEPAPSTPEALRAHVASEMAKWAKVVKVSGAVVN